MPAELKRQAEDDLQELISRNKKMCDHENSKEGSDRSSFLRQTSLLWDDFNKPALELAKYLLGKTLVRIADRQILSGNIVETEAYPGPADVASHSFRGKTERNKAMFMAAGTCYVYYIYGRQNCINISSQEYGGAVLFRAIEPVAGTDFMVKNRGKSTREIPENPKKKLQFLKNLTNGPSKMCQAMQITKDEFNCTHFAPNASYTKENDFIKIENRNTEVPKLFIANLESSQCLPEENIETATRIGIEGAGKEAATQPFRFYIKGNSFVSQLKKCNVRWTMTEMGIMRNWWHGGTFGSAAGSENGKWFDDLGRCLEMSDKKCYLVVDAHFVIADGNIHFAELKTNLLNFSNCKKVWKSQLVFSCLKGWVNSVDQFQYKMTHVDGKVLDSSLSEKLVQNLQKLLKNFGGTLMEF